MHKSNRFASKPIHCWCWCTQGAETCSYAWMAARTYGWLMFGPKPVTPIRSLTVPPASLNHPMLFIALYLFRGIVTRREGEEMKKGRRRNTMRP